MSNPTLPTLLWRAQGGRCYLRTTNECRAVGGALHEKQLLKGSDHRGWTWEHVIPRWLAKRLFSGVHLRLLACNACNGAKGDTLPSAEMIEGALRVHEQLPSRHDINVDKLRELARRFYAWHKPLVIDVIDDAEVPSTIEEALAQGGIFVDPDRRAEKDANARQLGVVDVRYLPGAKRERAA